ncbi:MAG TPA: hypothetical protein ENI27_03920 [bacterium]|nr:hypothetical protein [bacterium]
MKRKNIVFLMVTLLSVSFLLISCAGLPEKASAGGGESQGNIADTRMALERYRDVSYALENGYLNTYEYVSSPEGAMGIHFFNPTITAIDPLSPPILLYHLNKKGEYSLLGAEWFVPTAVVPAAPVLFGQPFEGPMPGHGPDQPEHYDLHVWLFETNPAGMFADFNTEVVPPEFIGELHEATEVIRRFVDFQVALDAGYINTEECAESPQGGMGVHFVNFDIQGIDSKAPPILLYQSMPDGSFELLGAEWFVPTAVVPAAPVLLGQTFEGPMPGHGPDQPEHYDLHAWLFKTNPAGMFADFNPLLRCSS